MKVLLVDPPFQAFMKYDRWYYPTSLTFLAALAEEQGHEVHVYDADRYFEKDLRTKNRNYFMTVQHNYFDQVDDFDHYIWKHYIDVLKDLKPDVVGVSIFTGKLQSSLNALTIAKEVLPGVRTCVGGAHVTAVPETLVDNKAVDGVFVGYSDNSFPEWLSSGTPSGIIKGSLTEAEYRAMPYSKRQTLMFKENYTGKDLAYMISSRGCVGRCTFCSNSFLWTGRPWFRTDESIRAEVEELATEWGVKKVLLGDSSNSDVPKENKRVASVIKESGMPWTTNVRFATVTRELLEHFAACGCTGLSVGLESGSDKILKSMRKGCTVEDIRRKAKMINELGFEWHLFTIVGFPDETLEDMEMTRELAVEIKPTSVSLNSLSPLPGTGAYEQLDSITPMEAAYVNQLYPEKAFSRHMELGDFQERFTSIMRTFEEYNAILNRNRQDL